MTLLALAQHSGVRIAEVVFLLAAVAGGVLALCAVTPIGKRPETCSAAARSPPAASA
jgi:hypothetical protein